MTKPRLTIASIPYQYPAGRISLALAVLATEWTETNVVRRIDPARVLAEAWNAFRLDRCRRQLAAGEQAPAISVVGYVIGRQTLYGVTDGMHRTVAHREAGRKIRARIEGYKRVEPQNYLLQHGLLWHLVADGMQLVEFGLQIIVPEELHSVLRALGVPEQP